jgi:hypothetical protein
VTDYSLSDYVEYEQDVGSDDDSEEGAAQTSGSKVWTQKVTENYDGCL